MMFQKRHYVAIAKALREGLPGPQYYEERLAVYDYVLAPLFARDNDNFKPDVFRRACGLDQEDE